jgi:hypothetical protein
VLNLTKKQECLGPRVYGKRLIAAASECPVDQNSIHGSVD